MPTMPAASPPLCRLGVAGALFAAILALAACNGEGVMAGGEYSGVPDTPVTVGRSEVNAVGEMRNDGTIILNRETGDYRPFPRR
jgi:hypothetical protein